MEENLPLYSSRELSNGEQVISPQTAYLMTNLLESVVQSGTGWRAKSLGRPVAAKTGTTDHFFDAWFIGYTPEMITGVWVGFDEETPLGENETGARAASPIWVHYMSSVLKDRKVKDFPAPEGIEFMKINPKTGQMTQCEKRSEFPPAFRIHKERLMRKLRVWLCMSVCLAIAVLVTVAMAGQERAPD